MENFLLIIIPVVFVFSILLVPGDSRFFKIVFLIIALLHWCAMMFFGFEGAVFSGIVFSTLGGLVWLYMKSYGRDRVSGFPFLEGFFITLSAIAVVSFGFHYVIEYYKTGVLNRPVFYSWLAIVVIPPLVVYSVKYVKLLLAERTQRLYFMEIHFEILHYNDYPVCIEQLAFKNSVTGRHVNVRVTNGDFNHPDDVAEMDVSERLKIIDITAFDQTISIPVGTNVIEMTWYAYTENRYYQDTFVVDLDKHAAINKYLNKLRVKSTKLLLKPDASAVLIIGRDLGIPYSKAMYTIPEEGDKLRYHDKFPVTGRHIRAEDVPVVINEINTSGRLQERLEMEQKQFLWSVSVTCPGEMKNMSANDFRYMHYESTYRWFNTPSLKSLPESIDFYMYNADQQAYAHLYFFLDKQKLYRIVNSLAFANTSAPIEMVIVVKGLSKEEISFTLQSGGRKVLFEDLRMNIVRYESVPEK